MVNLQMKRCQIMYRAYICTREWLSLWLRTLNRLVNTCIDHEDVNKDTKKMANGKVVDVTFITSELLKQIMRIPRHWILTIIDQAIKQGLPNDWLKNWIKPIFEVGYKIKISN